MRALGALFKRDFVSDLSMLRFLTRVLISTSTTMHVSVNTTITATTIVILVILGIVVAAVVAVILVVLLVLSAVFVVTVLVEIGNVVDLAFIISLNNYDSFYISLSG